MAGFRAANRVQAEQAGHFTPLIDQMNEGRNDQYRQPGTGAFCKTEDEEEEELETVEPGGEGGRAGLRYRGGRVEE